MAPKKCTPRKPRKVKKKTPVKRKPGEATCTVEDEMKVVRKTTCTLEAEMEVVPETTCTLEAEVVPERRSGWRDLYFDGQPIPSNLVSRPILPAMLDINIHHGGKMSNDFTVPYVGGTCKVIKGWDLDLISSIEVDKVVKSLGYSTWESIWFRNPKLVGSDAFKPLNCDADIREFINVLSSDTIADVYVQHKVETFAEIVPEIEVERAEAEADVFIVHRGGPETEKDKVVLCIEAGPESEKFGEKGEAVQGRTEGEENTEGGQVRTEGEENTEGVEGRTEGEENNDKNSEGVQVRSKGQGGDSDIEYNPEDHSDYSSGDETDISLDDSDYEENWDWASVLPAESLLEVLDPPTHPDLVFGEEVSLEDQSLPAFTTSSNPDPAHVEDFSNEDGDSSDIESPTDSDEEGSRVKRFPKFKPSEDEIVTFELGQIFSSKDLFKDALKDYALGEKKNVRITRNDKKRVVVKCNQGCPFYLRISKTPTRLYWQVVGLKPQHNCSRTSSNRQAKTKWLARKFMPMLRHTPDIKLHGLCDEARSRWGILISKHKAYRAKMKAMELI